MDRISEKNSIKENQVKNIKDWLDKLDEKVKDKSIEDKKKVYNEEIKHIENQRKEPDSFATIDCEMVRSEVWVPKDRSLYDYAIYYTSKLEEKGRFTHTIWPAHCLIGTEGHAVEENIRNACNNWTKHTLNSVQYVKKGMNLLTENFSVIEAEVPLESDPTTQKNTDLLEKLRTNCSKLIIVGQARSHCVRYTIEDIVNDWDVNVWSSNNNNNNNAQIIIPLDGSSNIYGFEDSTNEFINKLKDPEKNRNIITDLKCDQVFSKK